MSPEEYAQALEAERKARNERVRYVMRTEPQGHAVFRRTGSGHSTHVATYAEPRTATLVAEFLDRLKEDEA